MQNFSITELFMKGLDQMHVFLFLSLLVVVFLCIHQEDAA